MSQPWQPRTLGDVIREARTASRLSTRQLAKLSGVSQATIVKIESRVVKRPTTEHLSQLAAALDLAAAELYALAGYTAATDLPALPTYLRTKYRELPENARADVEQFIAWLEGKYGISSSPLPPGGDEQPKRR